ncbi:MAG: xylulokinase [Chloroflexia bacterium]
MGAPLFLGIDLGTSRLKLLAVTAEGGQVAEASRPIELAIPQPGWAEQDPTEWWAALTSACMALFAGGRVDPSQVQAIGLSGQMHGAVFLDAEGAVLRPCIIWADARTEDQVAELGQVVPRADLIRITGNAPNTGFTAPKVLWVRRHEPHVYDKTRHILLPKDYLRFRLTDQYATDVSDASATLMFDLAARDWSPDLLAALNIDAALLPPIHESATVTGRVSEEAARATGLLAGTPVVAGGGDADCAALGVALGAGVEAGRPLLSSIGTSGQVFAVTAGPLVDPAGRVHSLCYVLPNCWHVMGAILAGGAALNWLRDILAPPGSAPLDFDTLAAEAVAAGVGAEGVIFLPYLLGERTPHMDPTASAAFTGLRLHHSKGHLVRAVMEGVAFALLDGLQVLREMGVEPGELRPAGGGASMPLWQQIQRDVFNLPVRAGLTDHGAAYGAALLAAMGAGALPTTGEPFATKTGEPLSPPDPITVARYKQIYMRYQALYPALKGI